ncbi:YfiR family protein [Alteromonas sp. 5E99-2]|uniref:YfiR family protein n=1 Tax=Alteromonas sp. 5E99-2 TaxID=2817683 RepID=UPI001A980FE7|nr:YfiR family protein [Alteromonas sp. 5E99-2]MBO1255371.1 YfiR family protein [Alteromonas sp. 5E99-2]
MDKVDKVKAAYLFNFTKFINWSESHTHLTSLTFCLQTDPQFLSFFSEIAQNRPVGSEQIVISAVHLSQATKCDLVYITEPIANNSLDLTNTVTIQNEGRQYLPSAVFLLFERKNKLRFEIDLKEARRLNVNISSELLKLAKTR